MGKLQASSNPSAARLERNRNRQSQSCQTEQRKQAEQELGLCVGPSATQFRIPSAYPTLLAGAADEQYIGHFLNSYCSGSAAPVMYRIQSCNNNNLKFAARAGSMAFYSRVTGDFPLQIESSRWYERALKSQMAWLATWGSPQNHPTVDDVLTTLMLECMRLYWVILQRVGRNIFLRLQG